MDNQDNRNNPDNFSLGILGYLKDLDYHRLPDNLDNRNNFSLGILKILFPIMQLAHILYKVRKISLIIKLLSRPLGYCVDTSFFSNPIGVICR